MTGKATFLWRLALLAAATLTTPVGRRAVGSSVAIDLRLSPERRVDGSTIRGTLALVDALRAGASGVGVQPLAEGLARLDATLDGRLDDLRLSGVLTAAHVRLALYERGVRHETSPVFALTDLSTLFRLDRAKLVWHRLATRAYGGTVASEEVIDFGGAFASVHATIAARAIVAGSLPVDATGRTLAELARGRLAVDMRFDREGEGRANGGGDLQLEDGDFPVLQRSRASLAKYGVSPPAENAIAPATCSISARGRVVVPRCARRGSGLRGDRSRRRQP